MHIRLDSTNYELYTDGDGGENGTIYETGYVEWEQGTFTEIHDTLVFTSEEPIEFNTMISLKLTKTDSIIDEHYYFVEKLNRNKVVYWKVVWVENRKFNEMIFEEGICKYR